MTTVLLERNPKLEVTQEHMKMVQECFSESFDILSVTQYEEKELIVVQEKIDLW